MRGACNAYFGDDFRVECPTGSGRMLTLFEVASELERGLTGIFMEGDDGRRPVHGGTQISHADPHWAKLVLFYEYFHIDSGAGLGTSHRKGWTGVIARLIQMFEAVDAATLLADGREAVTYRADGAACGSRRLCYLRPSAGRTGVRQESRP